MNNVTKHRQERRYRGRYCRRGCRRIGLLLFEYGEVVLLTLLFPLVNVIQDVKLQWGEPREVRHTRTYVSFVGGRVRGYPRVLRQCYLMFVPGLLKHEATQRKQRMRGSLAIVRRSIRLSLRVFLPLITNFLFKFSNDTRNQDVREGALRISYTINLIVSRILAVIRRRHIPRVRRLVGKQLGRELQTQTSRTNYRRTFIIFARIVGALLTPPDVVSQVRVAVPMRRGRERTIRRKCRRKAREMEK